MKKEKDLQAKQVIFQISVTPDGDLEYWAPPDMTTPQALMLDGCLRFALGRVRRILDEEVDE